MQEVLSNTLKILLRPKITPEGARWSLVLTKNDPPRRYGQTAFIKDNKLYVFGGCNDQGIFSNQMLIYSFETGVWTEQKCSSAPPEKRHFHSSVLYNGALYIFGGKSNGYHNDMFRFDFEKSEWSEVRYKSKKIPHAVFGHTANVFENSMYIFGGYDSNGFHNDDVWQFSFTDATWTRLECSKGSLANLERNHHAAVVHDRSLFIFGGKNNNGSFADLLELHIDTKTWTRVNTIGAIPSPRHGHSACVVGDAMYVFGGCDLNTCFSDLYIYRFDTRRWQLVEVNSSPASRYFHSMVGHEKSLFIIGGKNIYNVCHGDMHILHISDDSSSAASTPLTRSTEGTEVMGAQPAPPAKGSRTKIRMKCHFEGEIRVISVDREIQYNDLMRQLMEEYQVPLRIQYQDEEGDMITVRSQSDLEEAFESWQAQKLSHMKVFLVAAGGSRDSSLTSSNAAFLQGLRSSGGAAGSSASVGKRRSNPPGVVLSSQLSGLQINTTSPSVATSRTPPLSPTGSSSPTASQLRSSGSKQVITWQKGNLLDAGAFGKVYLGMNCMTGELMAVKELPLQGLPGEDATVSSLQKEIELMAPLHHPNIVRYLGSERSPNALHIFLEYVPGGSLASLLKKFQRLPETVIRSYTKQIVRGLEYLHTKGIAHRDIKGANILVHIDGTVKLADFGTSRRIQHLQTAGSDQCRTVTGTPYYMAPEVIQGNTRYGRKADIWSLGAVVIEMATGFPPFHDLAPVPALFKIGSPDTVPDTPPHLSPDGKDFLSHCFQRDAKKRASASQLLAHPFLSHSSSPSVIPAAANNPEMFTFKSQPPPPQVQSPKSAPAEPAFFNPHSETDEGLQTANLNETQIASYLQQSHSIISLQFGSK